MAFNFPDSPTAGQIFTNAACGAQYVYTNGVWMQQSAAQMKDWRQQDLGRHPGVSGL